MMAENRRRAGGSVKSHPSLRKRYSTTTEPRTPTSPNGHGLGFSPDNSPTILPVYDNSYDPDDDVFCDEKLKQNNNDLPHFAPPPRTPGTAPPPDVNWARKRLSPARCIGLVVLIVLVVGAAVGVALAIIFTQRDTSSSSEITQTTSSPSTSEAPVITYSGTFQLESPWNGSRQQLQDNLSKDFISIVNNSSLQQFYRSSTLESYSSQDNGVSFNLKFSPDVTSLVLQRARDPVRDFLQKELRSLVARKETRLAIIPNTIHLAEYIPDTISSSSTIPTSSSPSSTSESPSTESETLTTESSSSSPLPSSSSSTSTTISSSSSATPSTTADITSVTTESSTSASTATTKATTQSSTSTTTEVITSTTTTTAPSSTSTDIVSSSSTSTQSSNEETSTPRTSTTTTEASTTVLPLPVECLPLQFSECQGLGYSHYSLPNLLESKTVQFAEMDFYWLSNNSLTQGCTSDPTLFCSFAFPPCSHESIQTFPCLRTCQTTVDACLDLLPFPLSCEGFPEESPCLQSPFLPNTTTTTTTTTVPDMCTEQTLQRCRDLGFQSTFYPTWFAENATANIEVFEKWGMPAVVSGCHPHAEFFMCSVFFPRCQELTKTVIYPCRSFCEDMENHCYDNGDILNLDCRMFDNDHSQCLLPPPTSPQPDSTTPTPPTTTSTASSTTPVLHTTPTEHRCVPIFIETCRQFGHVNGSLPNTWGATDEETTTQYYYQYLQPVVSSGCSASALFYTCAMLFPSCDQGVYLYPCRSVCEEYNAKCVNAPEFFEQDCSFFDDESDNSYCLMPPPKADCPADEFACEGAPKCIPQSTVCDRKNDCGDWSDERNCECNADFEYKCAMGLCIRNYKQCDGETDCPDSSDEDGCLKTNCTNGQFTCDDGSCIMREWVCDGQYDCPRLNDDDLIDEDEDNCDTCTFSQFPCTSGDCVPLAQRCDGTPQCRDHSDERRCIFQGPPVYLNVGGNVVPICFNNFTKQTADLTCQRLGLGDSITWKFMETYIDQQFFMVGDAGDSNSIIGRGSLVDQCGDRIVEIECLPSECGLAKDLSGILIGGNKALRGQVPWQASIQEFGKHFCGGSLIHPYFVLTAAHCVEKYTLNFQYLEVVLGGVDLTQPETGRHVFRIKRIINHPDYVTFQGNDVALVELTEPAQYSDVIQPLCLRQQGQVFSRSNDCYTSGWGKMDPDSKEMATHLQVLKMSLWYTDKCNSSFAWSGLLQSTEICAGYYAGIKASCRGDSGGPLFCQDNNYAWRLAGIASYVHNGCNRPEKPVVFSDAILYNDWIANNTVCQFQCGNGRCLFDKTMVCNKVDDCGDKSDEIDTCDISPNCTFDDSYLCGYRSDWLWVTEFLTSNRYPLFDHTIGRYPGMFLLAAFRGKSLYSPRIDLTSRHCFRFRYHMRGRVELGLAAHVHELSDSGNWTKVWHVEKYDGPDRWLLGQFDLQAGNFDIVFSAFDNGVATLDDTVLLPGQCKDQGCGSGEFACYTTGVWNCLPEAVRCNTVIDCDDAEDEKSCSARNYLCDFENGLLCGLEQDPSDSFSGEWRLLNSSQAGIPDLSHGDSTGHLLQIVTERLLTTDFVYMDHDLFLADQEHCLSFSYWSTSTVRMEIDFIPLYASEAIPLWTMENRQTSGWSRTQASIPAATQGHLYYTVIGRDLNRTVLHPMVALDDITITPGACPSFTCPSGYKQCSTEAYCLENSRFCDRKQDCLDFADEISCDCTSEEFKCPTGPCISLQQTCDTARDCLDGSDEGSVCDSLRSVSCDFEHQFMCGYTHNASTQDSAYLWSRERNRRPGEAINVATGPMYDHTYANQSGHWAFANGENGEPFDYVALESSPFASSGKDVLVFYYFAYSSFARFWVTGTLGVLLKNWDTSAEERLWFKVVDGNSTWRSACVALPQGGNLTVAFVSMRGQAQRADLAVDDVQLLPQTTCDQFYVESRLQTGAATQSPQGSTDRPPNECPKRQRSCRSGLCIDVATWCDGIKDCPDNSDETSCDTAR